MKLGMSRAEGWVAVGWAWRVGLVWVRCADSCAVRNAGVSFAGRERRERSSPQPGLLARRHIWAAKEAAMLVSTKGRYALRVMIDLAEHVGEGYLPLRDIARRQDISEKYLESILKVLVRSRLIEGLRGKGGGYRLTRGASDYTVGEVLRLTEGSLAPVSGLEDEQTFRVEEARCFEMWVKLDRIISDYLDGIKISDLCVDSLVGNDYVI